MYFALLQDSADEPLFESFYNEYNKIVYYVANDKLGNHEMAEDCVQEVFIKFAKNFHNIRTFLNDNRIEGLIRVVTKNMAVDVYRKNKRHIVNVVDTDLSDFHNISEEDFDICEKMLLKEAIDRLPEEIQSVFYLKYVMGYSGAEISQILDISEPLVRKRCLIGRQLAQKYIESEK